MLTFWIEGEDFENILQHYADDHGVQAAAYFVQQKTDYVRFSFSHRNGLQENLRISIPQWEALVRDYRYQQIKYVGPYITVEVE